MAGHRPNSIHNASRTERPSRFSQPIAPTASVPSAISPMPSGSARAIASRRCSGV